MLFTNSDVLPDDFAKHSVLKGKKPSLIIFAHSGPKMLKSKLRGAGPKFIYNVKGGYIVISKNKVFLKSVEGKF